LKKVFEASMAVAIGAKLCRPEVIPAYPITPQTHIVERLADFVNDGELDARVIHVESEHSALSAGLGASATGSRVFTATASQGLALMYEILPIVSGMRLPIVMAVANRALSAPINIWNDHSDSVSARDQGWIQLWVESSQEALDTVIHAHKIAEDKDILTPAMVNLDGFTLSHVWEPVDVPAQEKVDDYLPQYQALDFLNPEEPKTFGPIGFPNAYMEFKKQQEDAIQASLEKIKKVNKSFEKEFGRSYGNGLIETFELDDAEYALIGMGTLCGTAKETIRKLRKKGEKVGLIRLRSLRPFPVQDLLQATKNLQGLVVIDRHVSLGFEGPLVSDIRSILQPLPDAPFVSGLIAGLGGRDITFDRIEKAFKMVKEKKSGEWLF
jgi:pyruvate ferredoxin oxidoreductase alpha subunit